MYGYKEATKEHCVCAGNSGGQRGRRARKHTLAISALLFISVIITGRAIAEDAAVHIYMDSALTQDLISSVTSQYLATVKPSQFFANSYTIRLTGKNDGYVPPVTDLPLPQLSTGIYVVQIGDYTQTVYQSTQSINEVFTNGFAWGMETERQDNIRTLGALRSDVFETQTCGGLMSATTDYDDAFIQGCALGYNIATSTISLRDGKNIFLPPQ